MKMAASLFLFVSSLIIAQGVESASLAELKNQIAQQKDISSSPVKEFQLAADHPQKKSGALAILYSMVLPGMGELYAESYSSGKYFTIADGVLWGTLTGFNLYGKWQQENYKSFARDNGGINLNNKDDDYYANISVYQSIDDYNTAMEMERQFNKVYNASTHYWDWKNQDNRKEFRNMWSSSETAFNNVRFVAGALVLNRIISAINAVRSVSRYNKNLGEDQVSFYVGYDQKPTLPSQFTFNVITSF
jgi:hypothetical protein